MKQEKNKIQVWLDKLQQESWQLELIISSILLLIIGSYDDTIPDLILRYKTLEGFSFAYVIAVLVPLLVFIKSNLIVHIFLRGLWIGCVGLRYISSDIDFESFRYANWFDRFLKKKVLPFDNYIEKLERICSIIFSYSFLMVFHFLSFAIFIFIIQSLNYFAYEAVSNTFLEPVLMITVVTLAISGILNFIDFVTIGRLKKSKYFSYVFYPFYRIYNILSLSFLYRPIHYNFISDKLGRTYMLLMLPYMFLLAIVGNGKIFRDYVYIPKKENGSSWVIENNYDELRVKTLIKEASIDKLFYSNNEPIKLFLRLDDNDRTNDLLKKLCPEITSYDRNSTSVRLFRSWHFRSYDGYHRKTSVAEHDARVETSLACISKIYEVSIDSTRIDSLDYVFYQHPNQKEQGILSGININNLESGKHKLIIEIKSLNDEDELETGEVIKIPFFKN